MSFNFSNQQKETGIWPDTKVGYGRLEEETESDGKKMKRSVVQMNHSVTSVDMNHTNLWVQAV